MTDAVSRPTQAFIAATILLAAVATPGGAQTEVPRSRTLPGIETSPLPYVSPEEVGVSPARLETLVEGVTQWVSEGEVVGAEILLVKDGKVVLHEALGWSDREEDVPLRRNSIHRIRSMTKPFTGTAVFLLAEEGRIDLDASVATYLPSWRNPQSGEITIRQLLSHTGGFVQGGFPGPFPSYPSLRAAVDAVGEAGPQNAPGERYEYSDVGSATLGAVVAEVSGMPVEEFIETRILEPLELSDTHTFYSPDLPWAPRMNPTYSRLRPGADWAQYWHPSREQAMPFFRASGGIYTTVLDYARWLMVWMNRGQFEGGTLVSEETLRMALTPAATRGYGLHWEIFSTPPEEGGLPSFGHGGSDGTLAIAMPAANAVALVFTQSRGNGVLRRFGPMAWNALEPEEG
jgi:CubicO group peptidase (beta-lactamase class C family)